MMRDGGGETRGSRRLWAMRAEISIARRTANSTFEAAAQARPAEWSVIDGRPQRAAPSADCLPTMPRTLFSASNMPLDGSAFLWRMHISIDA